MTILDAAQIADGMTTLPVDPRAYLLSFYPEAPIPPLDHVVWTARPMAARINHGIWIASCECGARGVPSPGCAVWLSVPLGWCIRCQNAATGRGWRPIVVPHPEARAAIEAVLLCRPDVDDRNWEVGETIDDLIRQNQDQGDPIGEVA